MQALYTDGTPVIEGDRIRYRQTPGGLLPASPDWTYGIASKYPHSIEFIEYAKANPSAMTDLDELYLLNDDARFFHISGHIVEPA